MHLPTYLVLIGGGIAYGAIRAIHLWTANQLLFWAGVLVIGVNVAQACVQAVAGEDLEFKIMLWYLFPFALIAFGSFAGYQEFQNAVVNQVGASLPPGLPGKSSDYEAAAWSHFASMLFPLAAAGIAKVVQVCLRRC